MRNNLKFLGHFVEMVVAMVVGMAALGPLWTLMWPDLPSSPAAHTMVMATDMAIGMTLWMRLRGHGWRGIAEMSAAMYVPFLLLLGPYALGMISGAALMLGGHVLMLPAMLLAMLRHRYEYAR
jgi:flagellar biosynthetic protein FliP